MKRSFHAEFSEVSRILKGTRSVLLFAHTRPDPDTAGATAALALVLERWGKTVDIACYDPYPDYLRPLLDVPFRHPDQLKTGDYDVFVGCDSVDRGFHTFLKDNATDAPVILFDHHPNIDLPGTVSLIDPNYSSTCELLFRYFRFANEPIDKPIAAALLLGIMFDTGSFQHANVRSDVLEMSAELIRLGAPAARIAEILFKKQSVAALKLWGKAFEKAKLHPDTGLLTTVVTNDDLERSHATPDDIYQLTSILTSVPEARFILVLSERADGTVRGSLRALEANGVDVSEIARNLGGGGHKLASGFEVPGKIVETATGWQVV